MAEYDIIYTLPGSDTFSLFEKVLEKIYPETIRSLKQIEGINLQFLQQVYVITQNNEVIGRCCLYNNPELSYQNNKTACIGNFEFVNDKIASAYFLNYVASHAKKIGFNYLIGPMNGSTWDTYRLGIQNLNPYFFLEPIYPEYYQDLLKNNGFSVIAKYVSNIDRNKDINEERIKKIAKRFKEHGVTFRSIDLNNYEQELDKLYDFCMHSFKSNFLFTSINRSVFKEKYLKVKSYIKPDYVLIAENKDGEMVGFIFCLDNFNDKKEKGIIIKTVARKHSIKYGGMGNILASMIKTKALQNDYQYIIHAFMFEDNVSRAISANHFSGETLREYYLYGKQL